MIPIRDDNPSHATPYLTIVLIVVNVAVFLFAPWGDAERSLFTWKYGYVPGELLAGRGETQDEMIEARIAAIEALPAIDRFGRTLVRPDGRPARIGDLPQPMREQAVQALAPRIRAETDAAAAVPAWINIFSSMFLHGGWMHLIGNMLFLWIFGDNVEERLGRGLFLLFYLGTGIVGNLAHTIVDAGFIPLVGASGAISGIMGGYLVLYPHARLYAILPIGWYPVTFYMPAYIYMVFYLVTQNLFPAVFAGGAGNVAHWAHIGGFVSGMALITILPKRMAVRSRVPRPPRDEDDADFII